MNVLSTALVQKEEKGGLVYYTINWSALRKAEKYDIQKFVPAMAGVYELYYKDAGAGMMLFHYGKAWLGGLRAVIRELTDPILLKQRPELLAVVSKHECYYRFVQCSSLPDMEDILHWIAVSCKHAEKEFPPSGRYKEIRVKEIDAPAG
ncbi:MAG: hypothetical protein LBK44_00630 [Spirochaetales bacterium]|jgi:hypothetical protein|nr:hypothetical protein [Spirochaetales bacterium]